MEVRVNVTTSCVDTKESIDVMEAFAKLQVEEVVATAFDVSMILVLVLVLVPSEVLEAPESASAVAKT